MEFPGTTFHCSVTLSDTLRVELTPDGNFAFKTYKVKKNGSFDIGGPSVCLSSEDTEALLALLADHQYQYQAGLLD